MLVMLRLREPEPFAGAERAPREIRRALTTHPERPWVARVTPGGREFIRGNRDYTTSTPSGYGVTREYVFHAEEGERLEINEPLSWVASDRYHAVVRDGHLVREPEQG